MKTDTVFLCVGGDARQIYMSRRLAKAGRVYTLNIGGETSLPTDEAKKYADVLVLPFMGEGMYVPCSGGGKIALDSLVPCLKSGALVTGGRLATEQIEYFSALGFEVADYFKREELILKNCIPTAEGALQLAISETGRTVFGSRTLIVGYGRVAKATARLFSAVGAFVTCTARSLSAVAEAESRGYAAFALGSLADRAGEFDIIINTVPALVLDEGVLERVLKDTVIIDLASMPGGVDFDAARRLNRRTLHALGLPGKTAPITAGEIIAEAVINLAAEKAG